MTGALGRARVVRYAFAAVIEVSPHAAYPPASMFITAVMLTIATLGFLFKGEVRTGRARRPLVSRVHFVASLTSAQHRRLAAEHPTLADAHDYAPLEA